MKKLIAIFLVGMFLLISANSVLAYPAYCDSCGVIVEGYDECYRRTYAIDDCIRKETKGCGGFYWECYTDWCCINGHGTWTSNHHPHASGGHTCEMFINIVGCPY